MEWPLTGGGRLREVVAMRELTVFEVHSDLKTILKAFSLRYPHVNEGILLTIFLEYFE